MNRRKKMMKRGIYIDFIEHTHQAEARWIDFFTHKSRHFIQRLYVDDKLDQNCYSRIKIDR